MPVWVDVFIVVAAVAILVQMGILMGMWLQMRKLSAAAVKTMADATAKSDKLMERLDPLLIRTNHILEDSEMRIRSVMADAASISSQVRRQADRVSDIVTDATDRLQMQVMRVDEMTSGVLSLVEEAGAKLSKPVRSSVSEASAVLTGVKAGIEALRNRRRARPVGAGIGPDEELFI